jgi:UDP-N-acetylglucosamine 4-epimerase
MDGSAAQGGPVYINEDGETSRDFTYVANAVQVNLLAATVNTHSHCEERSDAAIQSSLNQVYNVAVGDRTTLNDLFRTLRDSLAAHVIGSEARQSISKAQPQFREFRAGDVRHSQADIGKARTQLGYDSQYNFNSGILVTTSWHTALLAGLH